MNIPELLSNVLDKIQRSFYEGRDKDFGRDYRALMKAVATYGYACAERGWHLQADEIYQDLMKLLLEIKTAEADVQYLPVYLAGAIRRHLGQRAEEMSAKAKQSDYHVGNIMKVLRTGHGAITRAPSDTDVLAEVFRGMSKIQKERRAARKAAKGSKPKQKQEELL